MKKNRNAVYAPGELGRVRDQLGNVDWEEAKTLADKLGGDVGHERTEEEEKALQNPNRRHEKVNVKVGNRPTGPTRRVELVSDIDEESIKSSKKKSKNGEALDPADNPSIPFKATYWERVKMDRLAGQPEFEIKSPGQVFHSIISLFTSVTDYVSPVFVTRRMPEYYKKIEFLVLSTRTMLPRNNTRRSEKMKKTAPLAFSILDVIRYWDIEKISGELSRIQNRPRGARVSSFADILREIYKPLFILDLLDLDSHIRSAYKILYKMLYIENPIEAQDKYQELVSDAITTYTGIKRDIRYLLYPLLLKSVSANYLTYNFLFTERKNRIMNFLNVTEDKQINPETFAAMAEVKEQLEEEQSQNAGASDKEQESQEEKDKKEQISQEQRERLATEEAEKKALDRGLHVLNKLFPKAGWDRPSSYPDFYPYYVKIFDLKKGLVNIAPTDPIQQIYILMRCLEELFMALRYVSFGNFSGFANTKERLDTGLGEILNNWHYYIETSYEREYLPRMAEYVRILEGSIEERNSMYTKKLITELHWIKRFYLLPFYKFQSLVPSPLEKKNTVPIYTQIKTLRKYLSIVAASIEQANKAGGADARAPCDGIENPWEPYTFQIPNPLSRRIDALLPPKQKNNASLVYFCLAITAVLDHLVNNEESWAYTTEPGPLFRSIDGAGVVPLTGVDNRIDADAIFRQVHKR